MLTVAGMVALGGLLRHLDLDGVKKLSGSARLLAVAILVPNTLTFFLDTLAWSSCFPADTRPSFGRVLVVRTGGEALTNSLPGGVVVGEVWKLAALARLAPETPRNVALGSLALAKLALASSQVVFVIVGLALGARALARGGTSLLPLVLTVLAFFGFFFVPVTLIRRYFLARAGFPPSAPADDASALGRAKAKTLGVIYVLAEEIARAWRERRGEVGRAFGLSFVGWIIGSLETWLALRALGVHVGADEAIAIESLGTIFRMVFFLAPGGIGAQDWGLTALLTLFGVPDPLVAGAGFAVVKRAREIVWIGIGLGIVGVLAATRREEARESDPVSEEGPRDG